MTNEVRLPRTHVEESEAPRPVRPSHQKVIEQGRALGQQPGPSTAEIAAVNACQSGLTLRKGRILC